MPCRISDGGVSDLAGVGDQQGLAFIPSRRQYDDSDLETEPEMPPTDTIIAKEVYKKLKPKERKRQDVINGMCGLNTLAITFCPVVLR